MIPRSRGHTHTRGWRDNQTTTNSASYHADCETIVLAPFSSGFSQDTQQQKNEKPTVHTHTATRRAREKFGREIQKSDGSAIPENTNRP